MRSAWASAILPVERPTDAASAVEHKGLRAGFAFDGIRAVGRTGTRRGVFKAIRLEPRAAGYCCGRSEMTKKTIVGWYGSKKLAAGLV